MSRANLVSIFEYAYENTKCIHTAMSAVNEHLYKPLTYAEFLSILNQEE